MQSQNKNIDLNTKVVLENSNNNDVNLTFSETILKQINIDKNLVLRVIENANGKFIDIRRFYKNYPTKNGVMFSYSVFEKLKNLLN